VPAGKRKQPWGPATEPQKEEMGWRPRKLTDGIICKKNPPPFAGKEVHSQDYNSRKGGSLGKAALGTKRKQKKKREKKKKKKKRMATKRPITKKTFPGSGKRNSAEEIEGSEGGELHTREGTYDSAGRPGRTQKLPGQRTKSKKEPG